MKSRTAWIIFILIVVGGIILGATAIAKRKQEIASTPTPQRPPIPVVVAKVKRGALIQKIKYLGKAESYSYATISTTIAGTVEKVYKKEGDTFKKGETLVKIDDSQIKESIKSLKAKLKTIDAEIKAALIDKKAAETILKNAKTELKREKFLYSKGAVPHTAVEKAENAYATAKAKVESLDYKVKGLNAEKSSLLHQISSLQSKLKYTTIKAVENGVVATVLAHEGDLAAPGKPLLKVFYPEKGMRVLVNLPPSEAKSVEINSTAKFENGAEGVVTKIYPAANPANGLYTVEVKVTKGTVKPGENVIVTLKGKKAKGTVVPISALLHLKNEVVVIKVNNKNVQPVKVKVLLEANGKAVVEGNLKPGDIVATGRESKLLEILRFNKVMPIEGNNE